MITFTIKPKEMHLHTQLGPTEFHKQPSHVYEAYFTAYLRSLARVCSFTELN